METLYSKIGDKRLRELVDTFYDLVFNDSTISHLFNKSDNSIRDKQFLFLTQFLGGPALYSEKYGHPKMKLRHLPHSIGEKERDEWLRCMKLSIEKMNFENDLGIHLYNCFPKVADHMRNK